jgi:hypothetical protein
MRSFLAIPALVTVACAKPAHQITKAKTPTQTVISHDRLADPFHPFGRCVYLGKSLPLTQSMAQTILQAHAPACADNVTIVNVAGLDNENVTPTSSDQWPGGDISLRKKGEPCLIHADLRNESGALMFATDAEIGLVCVSVEFLRSKETVWHADLVFMLAR